MGKSWKKDISDLFEQKKYYKLLCLCLDIINNRITDIFLSNDKGKKQSKTFSLDNINYRQYFHNIFATFDTNSYNKKLDFIFSKLKDVKGKTEFNELFEFEIELFLSYFNDICYTYGFIASCCIEMKENSTLFYFLELSHRILPCFVISDLILLSLNKTKEWITEKILISSILKVSDGAFCQEITELIDSSTMKIARNSYISWQVCLDSWLEYFKIKLKYLNFVNNNFPLELTKLLRHLRELFHFVSKSSLYIFYQTLLVHDLWHTLFKNLLTLKIQGIDWKSIKSLLIIEIKEKQIKKGTNLNISKILEKEVLLLLEKKFYDAILDLLSCMNALVTILVNIIHKYIKHIKKNVEFEDNLELELSNALVEDLPVSFDGYCIKIKAKSSFNNLNDFHCFKLNLCLANLILFQKLIEHCDSLIISKMRVNHEKMFKCYSSYLFLTMGIIGSLSSVEMNEKLLLNIKYFLNSQNSCLCFISKLGIAKDEANTFFKNIDGYCYTLIDCIVKRIFSTIKCFNEKSNLIGRLIDDILRLIIRILSLCVKIVENDDLSKYKEEKSMFEPLNRINLIIKIKTCICEIIIRYIQYKDSIIDYYFEMMEETIESLLINELANDADLNLKIDELILNFVLSIGENLINLCSKLKRKKNYSDSMKMATLGLKYLLKLITVPWIYSEKYSIFDIQTRFEHLELSEKSSYCLGHENNQQNFSRSSFQTPKKEFRNLKFLDNSNKTLVNFFSNEAGTYSRFWMKKEDTPNFNYDLNFVKSNKTHLFEINDLKTPVNEKNGKFNNIFTPFTSRLKNRGLSRIQSQTIKRIQKSTINGYISRTRTKKCQINETEGFFIHKADDFDVVQENHNFDFPIHILLFMLLLEQLLSSLNLQSCEKYTRSDLNLSISLIEENLSKLFTYIDDYSFVFILNNDSFVDFQCFKNTEIFLNVLKDENYKKITDCKGAQIIKRQFFDLLNSLISRYIKAKLILIQEFSSEIELIRRYPELSEDRNQIFKLIWFHSEIKLYKYYREENTKYSELFKKGIENGFCEGLVCIYDSVSQFYFENIRDLKTLNLENFRIYFDVRVFLFDYYVWLNNINRKYLFESKLEKKKSNKSYLHNMKQILEDLKFLVNEINSSELNLYHWRIKVLESFLFFENSLECEYSLSNWCKESFSKNKKIIGIFQECLYYSCKYFNIEEAYLQEKIENLISTEYLTKRISQIGRNKQMVRENKGLVNITETNILEISEFTNIKDNEEDIPIPIKNVLSNHANSYNQKDKNNYNIVSFEHNVVESTLKKLSNTANNVRFKIDDFTFEKNNDLLFNSFGKERNKMRIKEFDIFVDNIIKMLEIMELQEIEKDLEIKLINIALNFFSSCWIFFFEDIEISELLLKKEKISKLIDESLIKFSKENFDFNIQDINFDNEEIKIFQLNVGLLISILLYKNAHGLGCKTGESSSYFKWLNIAHLYNEGLIFLIENKYFISGIFIETKFSISKIVNGILFQLIVFRIEHLNIDDIDEICNLLSLLQNLEIDDFVKNHHVNIALFSRLYNRISDLFLNLNKPDISLLFLLESNKLVQILLYCYESNFINERFISKNDFSFFNISRISVTNLITSSLLKLSENWWKLGAIERSYSVYNKLIKFLKNWTCSYNKMLKIYFLMLPILLNLSFSKPNSHLNLTYNIDNEMNSCENSEDIDAPISKNFNLSLEELQKIVKSLLIVFQETEKDFFKTYIFAQNIFMMILINLSLYYSINKNFELIKHELTEMVPKFFYEDDTVNTKLNEELEINLILRKIVISLLNSKKNDTNEILMIIFGNFEFKFKNYYFNFFWNTIESYTLLFVSSICTDIVGIFLCENEKTKLRLDENSVFIVIDILEEDMKNEPRNRQSKQVEYLTQEICREVVFIKQYICVDLNKFEYDIVRNKNGNKKQKNFDIKGDIDGDNTWLNILELTHNCRKNLRTKIQILKSLKLLVNIISKNLDLSKKNNNYMLIYLNISLTLDALLLTSALVHPKPIWNKMLSFFIEFFTPITLVGNSCFLIYCMRKIQKEFEHYKIKISENSFFTSYDANVKFDDQDITKHCNALVKFLLSKNYDQLSIWNWKHEFDNIGNKVEFISNVNMRFSTFLTNSLCKDIMRSKFSLFQITKDFSLLNSILKTESKFIFKMIDNRVDSKLTLFYFVENTFINKFLENYENIQYNNVSSILNIDVKEVFNKRTRNWWNKRLDIELQLKDWLNEFSKITFKNWLVNLLMGWPKFINEKNHTNLLKFIKNKLVCFKSINIIDLLLFSLFNYVPQLANLLNNLVKTDIHFSSLQKEFRKIKFQSVQSDIKHFPVVIFLDRILMNLPIEGISELAHQPIIRGINQKMSLENWSNFMEKLGDSEKDKYCFPSDKCKIYYCINPTGDLKRTEELIIPYISKIFKDQKHCGISNLIPESITLMNEMNSNQTNLYLFCGHQAGEKFFQGELFEKGIINRDLVKNNQIFDLPPSLIIGCSSSRIRSYGSNDVFCTPMHYLIGGSPFVLGALWDVTDQDIDRFTISIFDIWFNSNTSLLESITLARKECKLPLLNGSSCVCFGYPL